MQKIDKDTPIDSNVIIPCPKVMFKNKYATGCKDCEYFDGLGIMCEAEGMPWSQRYTIRCTHPIERRTFEIQVE